MGFFEKHKSILALHFASVMIFLSLAVIRSMSASPFDVSFFTFLERFQSVEITRIMIWISDILSPILLSSITIILTVWLLYVRKFAWAIFFLLTLVCSILSAIFLKDIFHIARPIEQIIPEIGWGFPSAHATVASVFFFSSLYAVQEKIHSHASVVLWGLVGLVLVLSVGVSRVYLGVHFATDVLAGFALGTYWVTISILLFERMKVRRNLSV